jgi:hypothetical protein
MNPDKPTHKSANSVLFYGRGSSPKESWRGPTACASASIVLPMLTVLTMSDLFHYFELILVIPYLGIAIAGYAISLGCSILELRRIGWRHSAALWALWIASATLVLFVLRNTLLSSWLRFPGWMA